MKTIKIPSYLHEVFGEESTLAEILMILLVGIIAAVGLFLFKRAEWAELSPWKTVTLFLLIVDVFAGFIANLTLSTNDYYQKRPRSRLIFIAVHIQPLIFSFLLGGYFPASISIWIYTIIAAFLVNALNGYPSQRVFAAGLVTLGLIGLFVSSSELPILLLAALAFYHLKVVYGFSVNHYAFRSI